MNNLTALKFDKMSKFVNKDCTDDMQTDDI
jgi:hypothetical protein